MQYDAFSQNALQVVEYASDLARRYGCRCIGTEHILYGLINVSEGRAASILREEGVTNERFIRIFERNVDRVTDIPGNMFTPRTKGILENAVAISRDARTGYVGTEHMLLALLIQEDSRAVKILMEMNVNVKAVIEGMSEALYEGFGDEEQPYEEQEEDISLTDSE